jgi:GxxExxY protein
LQAVADRPDWIGISLAGAPNVLLQPSPLVRAIIGCAIEVHRTLGPGLLESAYRRGFALELQSAGLQFQSEVAIPFEYKGTPLDCIYRADFIVSERVLVEIKSIDYLLPVHQAQVLTYLKILKLKQGLLINFNSVRLVDGIRNVLN